MLKLIAAILLVSATSCTRQQSASSLNGDTGSGDSPASNPTSPPVNPQQYHRLVGSTGTSLFSIPTGGGSFESIQNLDPSKGQEPYGAMLKASDGKLYGLHSVGGSHGFGVLFQLDPSSGEYRIKHEFADTDGALPKGSLIQVQNGKLVGLATGGGNTGNGVIFEFDPAGDVYTVVHEFDAAESDGSNPYGALIESADGKLYGYAYAGGLNGAGTLYSFDLGSRTYQKEWTFDPTSGANPRGRLIQGADGLLYGLTYQGGANGCGVLFSFNTDTKTYTDLYDFTDTTGSYPKGSLLLVGEQLYGLTSAGGTSDKGVLFSFEPGATPAYQVKYNFDNVHGSTPEDSLVRAASDGALYGLTSAGGASDKGVLFTFNLESLSLTVLYDFTGQIPLGSLIEID
ncbi:MAG: choice-of-anchor tandem repeat GloVer-containing protein [Myxococcota bacterium]